MRTQVKVELDGMRDSDVDSGTSGNVAALADLVLLVAAEEASVVALLNGQKRDARLIALLQLHARHADCPQFVHQDLRLSS